MTLTDRDKKILVAVGPLIVVIVYWFILLAPKREEAASAAATLETAQMDLADAEMRASMAINAKETFSRDYASIVSLGKAIPTSLDMPSLLVQLEEAAAGTGIEFEGMSAGERAVVTPPATDTSDGAAAAPAPDAGEPQSGPGQAAAAAEGAADDASEPPPTADSAATAPSGDGTGTAPAPVAGGLESVSLEFSFKGSFFELANFFHRLKRFVYVDGERVKVRGRLMAIEKVEYTTDPDDFPALAATVTASVFLTPKAEGTTAGATPTGPAPAAPDPGAGAPDPGAGAPAASTAAVTP